MSHCLRYQQSIVCQHLASQYVAGVMTHRVKARTEALRKITPELDRAIAYWSDQWAELYQQAPAVTLSDDASDKVWHNIAAEIAISQPQPASQTSTSVAEGGFWNNLLVWRLFSGLGVACSMIFAIALWFAVGTQPADVTGPSYLANMVSHNGENQNVQFVISAYQKNDQRPSRIHVQWLKDHKNTHGSPLHVWAEDKATGELSYIGVEPTDGSHWDLTKPTWKAITNSSRLLVTSNQQQPDDSNTLFSGVCLQLKAWKKTG